MKRLTLLLKIRALEAWLEGQRQILLACAPSEVSIEASIRYANLMTELDNLKAQYRRTTMGRGIRAIQPSGSRP